MSFIRSVVIFIALLVALRLVAVETPAPEPVKPLVVAPINPGEKGVDPVLPLKQAANDGAKTPPPKSLYTRLGGAAKIAGISEDYVERLWKDAALGANVQAKKDMAELSKPALRFYVTTLLCQLSRGPEVYTGPAVYEIYSALKLTDDEWKALSADLEQTLDQEKVGAEEKKDLLAAVKELRAQLIDIVARRFDEKGVSAVLPAGWERVKTDDPGVIVAMNGPAAKDGGARPSLRISTEEFKTGLEMNAKEYRKANQLQMSKSLANFVVVQSQPLTFNNEPIEALACTYTSDKTEITAELFFYVKENRGYVIQFSGTKEVFEQNRGAFSDVLHSLKVQ